MSSLDWLTNLLSAIGNTITMAAMFISACASVWIAIRQHQAIKSHGEKLDRILEGSGNVDNPG